MTQKPILKVGIISDIQGYPYKADWGFYNLEKTLQVLADKNIDVLLNAGDIGDNGNDTAAIAYYMDLVKKYFPDIRFDAVLGQRDGVPVKPDPAIVNDICKAAGIVEANDIMYVGDSLVDLQTAANSGVEFVAVTWGFSPREALLEKYPAHIADTIEELNDLLLK
jgi:ribonucleotide monophosphatase NagD (HAD superfamily)